MASDGHLSILKLEYLLSVSDLIESQLLSDLQAHLCSITIDGLPPANDDIHITDLLDGSGKSIRGSQSVSPAKRRSVSSQPVSAPR